VALDLNTGLGIDFQRGFQEGLISNRGSNMVHEMGLKCPKCRTSDPAANQLRDGKSQTRGPNCANCRGDGYIYRGAIVVRGLATSIRQQKNVHDVGYAQQGDMQFSIGPESLSCETGARRVSMSDKFTATWDQPLDEGQGIVRGAHTMGDNLRLKNQGEANEDRLWYEPGEALFCEDENGETYTPGDFNLGPGRVISWVGRQPMVGVKYVLKYTAYFEWIVWAPPQERHDRDNRNLGPLVFLRKRHVAFINDSVNISASDRIPIGSRVSC